MKNEWMSRRRGQSPGGRTEYVNC